MAALSKPDERLGVTRPIPMLGYRDRVAGEMGTRNPRSNQAYTVIPIIEQLSRVVPCAITVALVSV